MIDIRSRKETGLITIPMFVHVEQMLNQLYADGDRLIGVQHDDLKKQSARNRKGIAEHYVDQVTFFF